MPINIENIKARFNIVDVIDGYIKLKKLGNNHHACCPFHGEKTASFTVSESKQFYHCFGCGAHGDVIGFVMEYERVEFIDAVKILTGDVNINSDDSRYLPPVRKVRLPLNQEQKKDKSTELLSKCELINGCYFNGQFQVIPLITIDGELVSLAMIEGRGFDIRFLDKQFMYGSCLILGNPSDNTVIVTDYWQSLSLFNKYSVCGLCVICIFDSLNMKFITDDLKRLGIPPKILCKTEEDFIQAEKLNIYDVYEGDLGKSFAVESKID